MDVMTPEQVSKAIAAIAPVGGGGVTQRELAEAMGWGQNKTMREVRRLMAAGRIKYAGLARRVRVDGVVTRLPVYEMVDPPTKK